MSEPFKIRCRHCLEINFLPALSQYTEPREQIVEEARRTLIEHLLRRNADAGTVLQRALVWQWKLTDAKRRPLLVDLAKTLGASKAYASAAVKRIEDITNTKSVNSNSESH